ncbi:hypothetical protein R1flu_026238 [Riccia fluitans]|uniref:Mur ligase central domain-containing protein n=1 Tax=Riccia fluitans TaxID=41844 RepID=A0ABD1XFF1_9MARC
MFASPMRSLWVAVRSNLIHGQHTFVSKWGILCPALGGADTIKFYNSDQGGLGIEAKKNPAGGYEREELVTEVEEYLNSLKNFEKIGVPASAGTDSEKGFDLRRMSRLLTTLGDPLSKYRVVHVAGTKGKGSTVAFISSILRAAGFRVGSYTSPHILSLRERIVSGETGQPISAQAFHQLYRDLRLKVNEAAVAESGTLTHFEVLTALAFAHFAREKVDIAVIETGLGGARDATNVIPASSLLAAVIVGVGKEHLEALGGSLESIAHAKAGIIKEGRPVILGRQPEKMAEGILRQVAASKNAPVDPESGHELVCELKNILADYRSPHQYCDISLRHVDTMVSNNQVWEMRDIKLATLGVHQMENAATAIQTALRLRGEGLDISDTSIRLGLENTTMPGRFQFASPSEAKALGSDGATIILDGAHTEGSAAALGNTLTRTFPESCLALVVAMASDKEHLAFARALLQGANPRIVVTTRVDIAGGTTRTMSASALADTFECAGQELGMETWYGPRDVGELRGERQDTVFIDEADSLESAVAKAVYMVHLLRDGTKGVVCVTGSLHAVSETLKLMYRQPL